MKTTEPSDEQLLAAFRRFRDEEAFATLVRRYRSLVVGSATRILGENADADDVGQAVFIALALRPPRQLPSGSLAPWLHRVTVRAALDAQKSARRRRARHEQIVVTRPAATPDADLDVVLDSLPARTRQLLLAHYAEGWTIEQLAAREGCAASALSMRLTRARERLRQRLRRTPALAVLAAAPLHATAANSQLVAGTIRQCLLAVSSSRLVEPKFASLVAAALRPDYSRFLPVGVSAVLAVVAVGLIATTLAAPSPEQIADVASAVATPTSMPNPAIGRGRSVQGAEHPLIQAAKAGYGWEDAPRFLAILQAHRGEINTARDAEGRTALHWLIIRGNEDYAALLLQRGAEVGSEDSLGRTPLIEAIEHQRTWTVFALLLRGADPDRASADGSTPLAIAVRKNDLRHAEILLWAGASAQGFPAERAGSGEMAALIRDYQSPQNPPMLPTGLPAFVENPLHQAAARGDYPVLEALLQSASGGPNVRDEQGRTALVEAIRAGQPEVVFYLLMMGADPNSLDSKQRSALGATMGWLGGGLDAMRRFLLLRGANPTAQRADGHTELTWAVQRDNEHGVTWLLWMGVDPRQTTRHGTPFEIAVSEGNQRLIDLFRRYGVDGPTRLSDDPEWLLINGARRGDIATIDEALAAGADVNLTSDDGTPVLMVAIYKRNVAAARHLLARGATMEGRARDGRTPLAATISWDYSEMTVFRDELLRAGADPNAPDHRGVTPVMRAVWHDPTMPLKQLMQFGADLNQRDEQGRTALGRARTEGKIATAAFLERHGAVE